jgi:Rieske Fe-S protein
MGASSGAGGGAGSAKGIPVAKVPVGSGVIDNDLKAVVTQPTKGEFKAFSYICTHQGCPVSQISGDTISCPCHGSEFSTKDGSVKQGPATQPLAPMTAKVEGSQVIVS